MWYSYVLYVALCSFLSACQVPLCRNCPTGPDECYDCYNGTVPYVDHKSCVSDCGTGFFVDIFDDQPVCQGEPTTRHAIMPHAHSVYAQSIAETSGVILASTQPFVLTLLLAVSLSVLYCVPWCVVLPTAHLSTTCFFRQSSWYQLTGLFAFMLLFVAVVFCWTVRCFVAVQSRMSCVLRHVCLTVCLVFSSLSSHYLQPALPIVHHATQPLRASTASLGIICLPVKIVRFVSGPVPPDTTQTPILERV